MVNVSCNFFDDPELPGSISINPPTAYAGDELSAVYSGSETVSYQWKQDGNPVGTNSNKHLAATPGTYTVTVSAQGFKDKTSAAVTVNAGTPELSGSISISPENPNAGTELSAVYSGSETVSYQWKLDGNPVGTNSNKYRAISPGTYTVTVSAPGYLDKTSEPVTVNATLFDIPAFAAQLEALDNTSIDNPGTVKPTGGNISDALGKMDIEITNAAEYIILDLSLCYAEDDSIEGAYNEPNNQHMNYLAGNLYIKGIILPSTLITIEGFAFSNCYNLTSITIPEGVTTIGDSAFSYCSNLTDISIPESVTTIGESAFFTCYNLTGITIPESVTTIGDSAFSYCLSLTRITFEKAGVTLGDNILYPANTTTSLKEAYTVGGAGTYTGSINSIWTKVTE